MSGKRVNVCADEPRAPHPGPPHFVRSLAKDRELMGENALGRFDRVTTAIALAVVGASVLALGVLTVF